MTTQFKELPCANQTREGIEAWLRANAVVGLKVAIRSCYGGFYNYRLATVDRINRGRLTLNRAGESGGLSFYMSGKNCFAPKGQTWLVKPTEEVLVFCDKAPAIHYYGASV